MTDRFRYLLKINFTNNKNSLNPTDFYTSLLSLLLNKTEFFARLLDVLAALFGETLASFSKLIGIWIAEILGKTCCFYIEALTVFALFKKNDFVFPVHLLLGIWIAVKFLVCSWMPFWHFMGKLWPLFKAEKETTGGHDCNENGIFIWISQIGYRFKSSS